MKKYVSLVLCLLLAALLFTGCAGGNGGSSGGGKTSDAAVNEALLGCFGKSADEAVKALGLKDDQKAGDYGYTLDYAWGGQTMETNLATNYGGAGVFGYASFFLTGLQHLPAGKAALERGSLPPFPGLYSVPLLFVLLFALPLNLVNTSWYNRLRLGIKGGKA